jgi:tetratricopeptide (TPR) repeat protein
MAARRVRNDEARTLYDRAHATYESAGMVHPAARVSARLADIDFYEGHVSDAVLRVEQALKTLSSEDPDEDVAEVASQLGRFLLLSGRVEDALPQLESALALAEALDLPEVFVQSLISKGSVLGRIGRREEAEILIGAALERALAEDLLSSGQRAANNLAAMFENRDAFAESDAVSERGMEIARRIGDRRMEEFMRTGGITTDVALGRWDKALATADEADPTLAHGVQSSVVVEIECRRGEVAAARERLGRYTSALETDVPEMRATYAAAEAIVLRAEGNARHALETAEQALPGAMSAGMGFFAVKWLLVEALECAFELGDREKLEELLGRIEELRPGERSPLLAAHAARFRAKLEPDHSGAEARFRRAEGLFREHGAVFPLAVAQLEHAERLAAAGRSAEAQPLFEEARETFERLEASPWVERALSAQPEEQPFADLVES